MSFDLDISKQAQKVIFSRKTVKVSHPAVFFNDIPVACCSIQKTFRYVFGWETKLWPSYNWKNSKANKGIGVTKKLHSALPCRALLTICKCFIRPNLNYSDFIYDQLNNDSFCSKIEKIQYNAALAIAGAIQGTSQTKLSNKLGLESLRSRRWFRHLCTLYKIKTTGLAPYLNMLPKVTHYQTPNSEDLATYQTRTNIFKYYFFPYSIMEWNKLSS